MKRIILSLALISLISLSFAQKKGITFEQNLLWQQIKDKAKAENKYIFVDVFASWCGPCKQMDREIYTSEKLGQYMNDKFVSVKVQADTSKTDDQKTKDWYSDAHSITTQYGGIGYPTFLFFSPEGKLVSRDLGFKDVNAFITIAAYSLDPKKQYNTLLEKFQHNKLDFNSMRFLSQEAKAQGEVEISQQIADNYIDNYLFKLKESQIYTNENLAFMRTFLGKPEGQAFRFFGKNADKINIIIGDYYAEYAMMKSIERKYIPKTDTWKTSVPDWNSLEQNLIQSYGELGKQVVYSQKMYYYYFTENWAEYALWYEKYYSLAYKHPRFDANAMSWKIFENVDNLRILTFACDVVMKYAIEQWYQNEPYSWDTYANLLYKIGRKDKAIEWEERAIKLSGNSDFNETLQKMKNNEKTWIQSPN